MRLNGQSMLSMLELGTLDQASRLQVTERQEVFNHYTNPFRSYIVDDGHQ